MLIHLVSGEVLVATEVHEMNDPGFPNSLMVKNGPTEYYILNKDEIDVIVGAGKKAA